MKCEKIDRKFPRQPERFENRLERMWAHAKSDSVMWRIPPVVMLEVRCLERAYFGGQWRTVWELFKEALHDTIESWGNRLRIKICDWMGWTKLYYFAETASMLGHWQRHGFKCSGSPNCFNDQCITDSVPKWFRWITRWRTLDEIVRSADDR